MKQQINNLITYIKTLPIRGCVTGSSLLNEHWEGMDVDVFCYDKSSFIELFYTLRLNNPMFTMIDQKEVWKRKKFQRDVDSYIKKSGIVTIKFLYNTCIPINIVLKRNADNIFSVLASFDMDIIAKGFDITVGKELDLTYGSSINRVASPNRWNTSFLEDNYSVDIWEPSRILRQLGRVVKYWERGYNTDPMTKKYIEIIDKTLSMENIFDSPTYGEQLDTVQNNFRLAKQICLKWLEVHTMTEKEKEMLEQTIKIM